MMANKDTDNLRLLRVCLSLTLLVMIGILLQTLNVLVENNLFPQSFRWKLILFSWSLVALGLFAMLVLSWLPGGKRLLRKGLNLLRKSSFFNYLIFPSVIFAAIIPPILAISNLSYLWGLIVEPLSFRLFLFLIAVLFGAVLLQVRYPDRKFIENFALTMLLFALIYRIVIHFPNISTYPFSMGWSEASRYYYSSLFFSQQIYTLDINPSVLHPSRYLLQALPFLFGQVSIWVHRAWQVFLWLSLPVAVGWLLAKRLIPSERLTPKKVVFAAWVVLFLFQGPIWYHLLVMVAIVLWGIDPNRFVKTLLVVGAASLWAGISRINWIPLPAAMAGLIYLLEVPRREKSSWSYLGPPALWGVSGVLLGLLSQWFYAILSGNSLEQFTSSFSSDLLWYRLLPNTTYPPGILLGILILVFPLILAVVVRFRGRWRLLDPVSWVGIVGILLVFLFGGLLVSVKIGGGSNLHNLDGFISLFLVAAAYLVLDPKVSGNKIHPSIVGLVLLLPVFFTIQTELRMPAYDKNISAEEIQELDKILSAETAMGGQVLFIAERQLLTFGEINQISWEEDYEKVFLMEMVMAGNREYLDKFHADLAAHRFDVIVTDKISYGVQTRKSAFSEENNIWDAEVNYYLICYYEVAARIESANAEILIPRPDVSCPVD